ncbi:protein ENHANCED DOWNY MILDEW 2 isoform X2 [Tripterygium wilfordii]|uniref:protein ENHANCED DOWNY MILDEW 2 isoform X2 n=1 Tax=Tripterygium wilfordii TaxID=458696 RepID=UPI0018F7F49B|nr:protein ENHANCED DOWNY MILDEW 2 isoform X2 [Tripterygium wilfordii]
MASSDDDSEEEVMEVMNYYFEDDRGEPFSFYRLPLQCSESDRVEGEKKQVSLRGEADNGLRKIWCQVKAWKFDLLNAVPEISVLSKDKKWIKLGKPRKSYEETSIRTILITLHFIHYVRRNPEASPKSVWDYLSRVFGWYEVRPSQDDLVKHTALIRGAVKRDDALAKSKPGSMHDEDFQPTHRPGFIVNDMDEDIADDADDDGANEDDELFDSVCAFCDNGGELLCCDGKCMRSFHATEEAGEESMCVSLGFSIPQVEAMQKFFCKNCEYNQHQCFACGKLGSSEKSSSAEVFRCVSATCGLFYHPHCVAVLLHSGDEVAAIELQKKIATGESFTCPIHKCCACGLGEDKKVSELQFAICRRCPTSYHQKCLPREIALEDIEEEDIITRAWKDLLPNRILIYCLKHEIDEELGTPIRDHIIFPSVGEKKSNLKRKIKQESGLLKSQGKILQKNRSFSSEESFGGMARKVTKELPSAVKKGEATHGNKRLPHEPDSLRKVRGNDASQKFAKRIKKSVPADASIPSLGDRLFNLMTQGSEKVVAQQDTPDGNKTAAKKPTAKEIDHQLPPLDVDTERRLSDLIKKSETSITMESVVKKHKMPSTHKYSARYVVDKTITTGKVEGSVEAVRAALQKLENGCSIEDAKVVCEPEILSQVSKWRDKLQVYLAPFLNGPRYTSFGRHFTKVDKLEAIVEKLQCYVEDGDMIVDFCCGANDFSCLLKRKLDASGKKKCSYQNYDIMPAQNDFNFKRRDWMTVPREDLPQGSRLIMGLNPPFGVRGALANKFIDKALEFCPKLLILIVPPETERLDKKGPYDLVWEDAQLLSGKSFYLPGSVDENDKRMDQWNLTAPPLYLWSRRAKSAHHRAIALKHGHLSRKEESHLVDQHLQTEVSNHLNEDDGCYGNTSVLSHDIPMDIDEPEEFRFGIPAADRQRQSSTHNNCSRESQGDQNHGKNPSIGISKKEILSKENSGRQMDEKSPEDKKNGGRSPVSEVYKGNFRSEFLETPLHVEVGEHGYQRFDHPVSSSPVCSETAYASNRASIFDDFSRKYGMNHDEPYSSRTESPTVSSHLAKPFSGHTTNGAEGFGHQSHVRESELQSRYQYGQDATDPIYRDLGDLGYGQIGSQLPTSYSHVGPVAASYLMNMSVTQRYAPRLDEMNHPRMPTLGSEPPPIVNRNEMFDPRAPQRHFQDGSMGFPRGPHNPIPHPDNSNGWLN